MSNIVFAKEGATVKLDGEVFKVKELKFNYDRDDLKDCRAMAIATPSITAIVEKVQRKIEEDIVRSMGIPEKVYRGVSSERNTEMPTTDKERLTKLEEEREEWGNQIDRLNESVSDMSFEMDRLRKELETERGRTTELKSRVENLGLIKNRLEQSIAESHGTIQEYEERLQLADRSLAEITQLIESIDTEPKDRIVEVQIKNGSKVVRSTKGLFHEKFGRIVELAEARKNIFLYGPTGCGKSHVCKQVAEALGLEYSDISCTNGMSEGQLGGRLLPVGNGGKFEYVISDFVRLYENGGLFLIDEMDAADSNVLLLLNTALSNKRMSIPWRIKKPFAIRSDDFVCIAAANTVGTGADRAYVARSKLDASTLDRYLIGKIKMDYDPRVESILCPDEVLRDRCYQVRRAIAAHRLDERFMSTRFFEDAYYMKTEKNWTEDYIFGKGEDGYFAGWREDEINKVLSYRD